jgi:hypothetical protein
MSNLFGLGIPPALNRMTEAEWVSPWAVLRSFFQKRIFAMPYYREPQQAGCARDPTGGGFILVFVAFLRLTFITRNSTLHA